MMIDLEASYIGVNRLRCPVLCLAQKVPGQADGVGKPDAFHRRAGRKGACQARWQAAVKHHEYAPVGTAPD